MKGVFSMDESSDCSPSADEPVPEPLVTVYQFGWFGQTLWPILLTAVAASLAIYAGYWMFMVALTLWPVMLVIAVAISLACASVWAIRLLIRRGR